MNMVRKTTADSPLIVLSPFILLFLRGKLSDVLPNSGKGNILPKLLLYLMEWFLSEVQKGAKEEGDASGEVLYPSFVICFKSWYFFLAMDPPLFQLILYRAKNGNETRKEWRVLTSDIPPISASLFSLISLSPMCTAIL